MNKHLILAATLIIPLNSYAADCRYSKDYDFAVDANDLRELRLNVGSGSLSIEGDSASSEVRVVATACAHSNSRLNDLELTHRVRDSDLLIRTEQNSNGSIFSWFDWGNNYAYIDIEISMPQGLALDVDDGSGSVEIYGVSALSLNDGSGSVTIENIQGDVYVDDGSGAISITGVNGRVSIDDGSGPIRVRDSLEVVVLDDGSGAIDIDSIQGNVDIRNDGSGGISIREVGGDVEIDDAGSGSVDVREVAGTYINHDD